METTDDCVWCKALGWNVRATEDYGGTRLCGGHYGYAREVEHKWGKIDA